MKHNFLWHHVLLNSGGGLHLPFFMLKCRRLGDFMYETLTEFERALARFGDKVALIAGLEISDKMTPEEAYQQIKDMMKELKSLRKVEKNDWNNDTI